MALIQVAWLYKTSFHHQRVLERFVPYLPKELQHGRLELNLDLGLDSNNNFVTSCMITSPNHVLDWLTYLHFLWQVALSRGHLIWNNKQRAGKTKRRHSKQHKGEQGPKAAVTQPPKTGGCKRHGCPLLARGGGHKSTENNGLNSG